MRHPGLRIQKQANRHKPEEGIFGDCDRTSIAILLGLDRDEVPHFRDGVAMDDKAGQEGAEQAKKAWLRERGLSLFAMAFAASLEDVLRTVRQLNGEDFCYILIGKSGTGVNHAVVCRGDQIIADPSITGAGIIGPCDDGYFWVDVIVPAFLHQPKPAQVAEAA